MTNPNNFRQVIIDGFFFSGVSGSWSSMYLASGTASVSASAYESASVMPMGGIDSFIYTGESKRVFLICRGCGRKYLLKEENITTPIFDMSCECGTTLEIEEEK